MSQTTKFQKNGFEITKDDGGRIISVIENADCAVAREIKLGQKVYSNGRLLIPDGIFGIVVGLHEPYHNSRTTNIFEVWFEGDSHTTFMKTKDLMFE